MLVAPVLAVAAPRRNEHALQPTEHALQPKDTTAELAQQLLVRHAVKAELARLSDDELAAMVPRTAIVMSPEGTRCPPIHESSPRSLPGRSDPSRGRP